MSEEATAATIPSIASPGQDGIQRMNGKQLTVDSVSECVNESWLPGLDAMRTTLPVGRIVLRTWDTKVEFRLAA